MFPFFAVGTEELKDKPIAKEDDKIICSHCEKEHILECGTVDGRKSYLLLFYKCGHSSYLAAIKDRLVLDMFPRGKEKKRKGRNNEKQTIY